MSTRTPNEGMAVNGVGQGDQPNEGAEGAQVVYLEPERGMRAAARQAKKAARSAGRSWVSNSVDAPLPQSVQGRLPQALESARGRVLLAVAALTVLAVWAAALAWVLG